MYEKVKNGECIGSINIYSGKMNGLLLMDKTLAKEIYEAIEIEFHEKPFDMKEVPEKQILI